MLFLLLPQDIPLAAPVTIVMKASASVASTLPSCSYFDEETGLWDSTGLVLDSVTILSEDDDGGSGGGAAVDVHVSCVSFHLSDFSVTTTEVEPVFRPVTLVRDRSAVATLAWGSKAAPMLCPGSRVLFICPALG